ncbi:MAG: ABC transporter permease [Eubacterium sp.]|nr:ABC transporter permease [Eubacterium sp.]
MKQNSKENIYSLIGFGKVFRFTLKQTLKNKGFVVAAVMMIFMMGMMKPLMYFMSKSTQNSSQRMMSASISEVEAARLFIYNETDYTIDKEMMNPPATEPVKAGFLDPKNITIYNKDEAKEDELIAGLTAKDILVVIRPEIMSYTVNGIIADASDISVKSLDNATSYVEKMFTDTRKSQMSLDDNTLKSVSAGVSTKDVVTATEFHDEKAFTMGQSEFSGLILGFCLIIMVVSSLSASYIISSVNEEKTSKLAETLLVSVRPMALLLGKVLGMLIFVAGTIVIGVLTSYIVDFLMHNVMKLDMSGVTQQSGINLAIFTGYGAKGLAVFFVEIVIALLTFGVLSGIMGSACSKTEDQQNATTGVMMITMIGYLGCVMYFGMKSDMALLGSLIPPFSFFMAPVAYIGGRISLGILLASFASQIAILIGLLVLGAKTYRNLLLSDSSRPKLASIFAAAKN